MKKYIVLLALTLSIISCANDDETSKQDSLLGQWKLIEIRESNGTVNKIACHDAILLHFKTDGSFDVEHFDTNESNDCISMGKIDEGVWKSMGNNSYSIDGDSVTPQFEDNQLIMISTDDTNASKGVYERQ